MNTSKSEEIRILARAGCALLVEKQELGNSALMEGAILRDFGDLPQRMEKALDGRLNVENVKTHQGEGRDELILVRLGELEGVAPILDGFIRASVHLSQKNQGLPEGFQGSVIEDFTVVYNGSAFIAFAVEPDSSKPLAPFPWSYDWQLGRAATDVIKGALTGLSENHVIPTFGPCPLHPCIYLKLKSLQDNETVPGSSSTNVSIDDGDIVVTVTTKEPADLIYLLDDYFASLLHSISEIYSVLLFQNESDANLTVLDGLIEELADIHSNLSDLPVLDPRNIISRYRLWKLSRRNIATAYYGYRKFASSRMGLDNRRRELLENLSHNPISAHFGSYCETSLWKEPLMDLSSILQSLTFFENWSRSRSLESTTFLGALLGGVLTLAGTALGIMLVR